MIRRAVHVEGTVQGVGFRPFVRSAALAVGLSGWVQNATDGVLIEVQGGAGAIHEFVGRLRTHAPPAASIADVEVSTLAPQAESGFVIRDSRAHGAIRPTLPPDLATCVACAAEVNTPGGRRYRYPFTNCTQCGPRFTLVEQLPYDRPHTTMARFELCALCRSEYEDPQDRRFHAQPIACPTCGPTLRLVTVEGHSVAAGDEALARAAAALARGETLALQGLGGFQLLVDATNSDAVARLRERKRRSEKPFAVMFPALVDIREACLATPDEEALLCSPGAPIVIMRRNPAAARVAQNVAPGSPLLGALLPYTPLHLLLLSELARPLVCTSGNLAEEPMCVEEREALLRLAGVADLYLVHDRPIARPVDDSLARVGPTGAQVLRRARGYAPLPHPFPMGPCTLALGGQLKSTVTLAKHGQAVVSQHLGDLSSVDTLLLLERTVTDLLRFCGATPELVACDGHEDYASTRLAERLAAKWSVSVERVQHHHAHVAACVAEHQLEGPVLGLAWDGSGAGMDGTLWGGEALVVDGAAFQRFAHLRPFPLPGGERAIREPRRAALGLLFEAFGVEARAHLGPDMFADGELSVLLTMLERRVSSPRTTSVGRLFDAVAALAGVRATAGFEAQAAMELEFASDAARVDDVSDGEGAYPLPLHEGAPAVADWGPLVGAVLADRRQGAAPGLIGARFHGALAQLAEAVATRAGLPRVVLTGGCFQNQRLTRAVHQRLMARGFDVYMPTRFPSNDGGLSLGQAYVAVLRRREIPCASAFPVK